MDYKMILTNSNKLVIQKLKQLDEELVNLGSIKRLEKYYEDFIKSLYEKGYFDFELFKKICQIINVSYDFDEIKTKVDRINKITMLDYILFEKQINEYKIYFKNIIQELDQMIGLFKLNYKTKRKELKDNINFYKMVKNIIESNGIGLLKSEKNKNLIIEALKTIDFSKDECDNLISEIIKAHEEIINNDLVAEEKEEQNEDIISEENKKIYEKVLKIINNSPFENFNCNIPNALSRMSINAPIEKRILLYSTSNEIRVRLLMITVDLKENFISQIEIGNYNNFKDLELILNLYDELFNQYKKLAMLDKNFCSVLSSMNFNEEARICEQVEKLLITIGQMLIERNKQITETDYSKLFEKYELLKGRLLDYKEAIKNLILNIDEESDLEMSELCYEDLKNTYIETNELKQAMEFSQEEKYLSEAEKFYNAANEIKNIYVFLDEDEIIYDIENEEQENKQAMFTGIVTELSKRIDDSYVTNDDHKIKTDFYGEEFLKKYHVKSMKTYSSRIFYSRFNTNLNNRLGFKNESPRIVFIIKVGYGKVSYNSKNRLNQDAIKNCYFYKDDIDRIVDLLNPDWSKLTEDEIIKKNLK